jgi:hypothetical protein
LTQGLDLRSGWYLCLVADPDNRCTSLQWLAIAILRLDRGYADNLLADVVYNAERELEHEIEGADAALSAKPEKYRDG